MGVSVPRALRALTVRWETWATCTQAHVCSFPSAPMSKWIWVGVVCVQPCEGDHPIKAVSRIKLKYLLGGLGPRESRGVAQAGRQEAQTAEPCGPRWVWDKRTGLLPCEGDPTGFQNSQGFETGLEGQLGCFDRQR